MTVPTVRVKFYVTTGRSDEAKKIYTEILAQRPYDVGALLGLGEIAVADKRWPDATDYITRARTAAPSDPRPGLMLVNMYGLQQDWKTAAPLAAELVAQFPANVDVLDAQGRVQIGSGDMDGALSTYKRAYALAPNSGPLLSRYLALLNQSKNFADANIVLQTALDRDPQNSAPKAS
jgi:predicted Zn-dependent protease